ncbi:TrbI/VirB10 family protein [Nostoc sp.]|uniref:TrbI/VirB10 family protein n=1 Tax=Nostoc sp. TaxID=1180 RepID=UPI002FFC90DA
MTKYSLTSKTSAQNLYTQTLNELPLEVDSLDWESRMASLVGFEEESPVIEVPALEDSTALEQSVSQPQKFEAKQLLSSNPFAKLSLVGTATLAILLLAAGFLFKLMDTSSQKPKNNIVVSQVQSQLTTVSSSQGLEGEIEILKTKLALTEQAELTKNIQQNLKTKKLKPPQLLVTLDVEPSGDSRNKQPMTLQRTPTLIQKVSRSRIVTVKQATQPSQIITVKPDTQPVVYVTPPSTPNLIKEWTRLAKLGSYGQVNFTGKANSSIATYAPPQNTQLVRQIPNSNPNQTQPQTTSIVSQAQLPNLKLVAVGTSAKAVLATAVFGETTKAKSNKNKNENKNIFVVRLKQPLKSVDGAIALPANTELLTEVRSISQQGLIKLDVVKVMVQNNRTLTEKSLPQNAIIIRAPQGKPLIANQFSNQGSSIAGMDVGVFFLGAAGKAGELYNRTDSQITITSNSAEYTTNNSRDNILAGLVEGGINTVLPPISQRNQQAISKIRMQRTNIWFLHAGKDIEIYVNQAMQF